MRNTILLAVAAVILVISTGVAYADADGPDYYQVTSVAADDVLNIRTEPDPHSPKIGEIPPNGVCIRNLGCKGGLTYQEFTELSEERKALRLRENPRWCRIEYEGVTGWVASRYLGEGTCER